MSDKMVTVRMEENYMRVTIRYDEPSYKADICKNVALIEKDLNIFPEILHRKDNGKKWFCTAEFAGEDYVCSRKCGEFIEKLIHNLGLENSMSE